ncbi:MBL fold metallo-hydrolase [Inconstantimicrobium mannanitabidum]|uniref:MBL fold metallo-hydrolase n=1 Tax=Inconstantimicrobium mannanitabidum TaxID=1604901 RepID=A0ACB5RGF0_9CLOT|nr:MBL fold metallo-hydrolase [Clostridium sp. TW13]GKX68163.1 MBL fold metallo-hydrolase [Clostridium sp. TW13]
MEETKFFVQEICKDVYLIDADGKCAAYLVVGESKAVLIDTTLGFGDIYSLVKGLTNLPVVVVNTHAHCDHVWGNYQFEEAYISEADMTLYKETFSAEEKRKLFEMNMSHNPSADINEEEVESWINLKSCKVLPIKAGDVIDIGNKQLKVIELPGHTAGSIALLDEQDKTLFGGDSIIGWLWMQLPESVTLTKYLNSMKELKKHCSEFNYIYTGHARCNDKPFNVSIIDDIINDVGKIIDGTVVGSQFKDERFEGLECKFENWSILYDGEKVK